MLATEPSGSEGGEGGVARDEERAGLGTRAQYAEDPVQGDEGLARAYGEIQATTRFRGYGYGYGYGYG